MTADIFSSFDPASLSSSHSILAPLVLSNMPLFIPLLLIPFLWAPPAMTLTPINSLTSMIWSQLTQTSSPKLKGMSSTITTLFLFLIPLNLSGLIPYTFSPSSHLMITLILGLPLWLSTIISALNFNPYSFIASLLPSGAPSWLNPLLNIIELVSMCIRPLTLSFRLAANMTAGHIVLALISAFLAAKFLIPAILPMISALLTQSGYTMFEVAICFIQAFIFCLLLSLYSNDHPAFHF